MVSYGAGKTFIEKCCGSEALSTGDSANSWWICGLWEVERIVIVVELNQ
jgi:hypothetical protein